MAKIGRNDKCPCRSGKKYKHCCSGRPAAMQAQPASSGNAAKVTLMSGVAEIQERAERYESATREIGVFFFFSTLAGDAWLLEMTDCDCIQLASKGTRLDAQINENPEIIEVNWGHTFKLSNKTLELTAYADKSVILLEDAPSQQINAMLRRINKKFSADQLREIHVDGPESPAG